MKVSASKFAALWLLFRAVTAQAAPLEGSFECGTDAVISRDAAIEKVVSEMFFLVRPIARERLRASNVIVGSLAIVVTPATIRVTRDGVLLESPRDGTEVRWTAPDGRTYDVSQRVDESSGLEQRFRGPDGTRVNALTPTNDGGVSLGVTVTSPKLPIPLHYTLAYERSP